MSNTNQAVFTVDAQEANKFAQVWTYKGLAVPIGPEHCQFATDFANTVLRNFLLMVEARTRAAARPAPLIEGVTLAEPIELIEEVQ